MRAALMCLGVALMLAAGGLGCGPAQPAPGAAPEETASADTAPSAPSEAVPADPAPADAAPSAVPDAAPARERVTPSDDPAVAAQQQQALVAEWFEAAKATKNDPMNPVPGQVTMNLFEFGPEALLPLVDVIGDPNVEPYVKVVAVDCLNMYRTPVLVEKLVPLTAGEHDGTTRSCAAFVLALSRHPKAREALSELTADPERRVQVAALVGMLLFDSEQARDEVLRLWDAGELSLNERVQVANVVGNDVEHQRANIALLGRILKDQELPLNLRRTALTTLARTNHPEALPILDAVAEADPDESQRGIATSAAKRIRALLEESGDPAPKKPAS